MSFQFQWDERKASSNAKKHGITFRYAALVFQDPLRSTELEGHDHGEARWRTIGSPGDSNILVVSYALGDEEEGEEEGIEYVRVISARRATRSERRTFERISRVDR